MTTETINLRTPSGLIGAVPYLLGFQPERSLVLIGLDGPRLVVTARVDLADVRDDRPHLVQTIGALTKAGADALIGVVYSRDCAPEMHMEPPESRLVESLRECAGEAGLDVKEVILVCDGRWWAYSLWPDGGSPIEEVNDVAAEFTARGSSPFASRAEMEASLAPRGDMEEMVSALVDAEVHFINVGQRSRFNGSVKRALFKAVRDPSVLTTQAIARFGVALDRYAIRDPAWLAIDEGRLKGDAAWREMATRLPAPYNAAPLFLLAWSNWRDGDGVIAGIAAERALEADPGYSAANMLLGVLARGADPRTFPRLAKAKEANA